MLKRQFSIFKNQLPSNSLSERYNQDDDTFSASLMASPRQQTTQNISQTPQSPSTIKKLNFMQTTNQSKKNSISSPLSFGNTNSSYGFKQSQNTYFTDRVETEETPIQKQINKLNKYDFPSERRVKTQRTSSMKEHNIENSLKFTKMMGKDGLIHSQRKSEQPSLASIVSQQSKTMNTSNHLKSTKNITQRRLSINNQQSQIFQGNSQVNPINETQVSIASPNTKNTFKKSLKLILNQQSSLVQNSPNQSPSKVQSPFTFQRIISEINNKKTPFTNICRKIQTNMQFLQKKIKSKVQFFNHMSKLLSNKSHHLQGIFLISEIQEVVQDAIVTDRALVQVINGAEFRSSPPAQRAMIKNLLLELSILNKEIFNVYLLQSKQEINNIKEKILYEREEVDFLTVRLSQKHYPNFSKKATLINNLSHQSMPITYNKEKYDFMEEKFGKFSLISQENRFVCSEIEKIVCNLKQVNYGINNPYRNSVW